MIIIYNPVDGAPITSFICKGVLLDPHFPDGYELSDGKLSNGLVQYEDLQGLEILETYQFLRKLSVEQAKEILNRPEEEKYKCDYSGCNFATHTPIALSGHKRKHAKDLAVASLPIVDSKLIPVASGKKITVFNKSTVDDENDNMDGSIPNGPDRDGVDWYGPGAKRENLNNDFNNLERPGQGHFVG